MAGCPREHPTLHGGVGPCTVSLAQLHPPVLLHGHGRMMLQPSCHAEDSEFLDPPQLSSPPSWIPESQKPLGICPRALQQPPHLHSCEKEISLTIQIFNIYLKSVEAEPAIASTNARPGREPVPASQGPGMEVPQLGLLGILRGSCLHSCHPLEKKKGTPATVPPHQLTGTMWAPCFQACRFWRTLASAR